MNDSHHSARTPTGGRSTFLLVVTVLLPVLYVLSIGPMNMLAEKGLLGPVDGPVIESLSVFYLPLNWCVMYLVPGLAPALDWYLSLWGP